MRYHLWAMIATALGLVIVASERSRPGRVGWVASLILAAVVIAGALARAALPLPPQTYAGMLG